MRVKFLQRHGHGHHHGDGRRHGHSERGHGERGHGERGAEAHGYRGGRHGGGRHGERLGRFFEHGDLRLVILALIAEKPRHGYEIIKAIEERVGGAYSPSPGVVYPTLTMLEEIGHVTVEVEPGGKKLHTITAEGEAFLEANRTAVNALMARITEAGDARMSAFMPSIVRGMENLKLALRLRVSRGQLTEEQARAIAAALDAAAIAIEQS